MAAFMSAACRHQMTVRCPSGACPMSEHREGRDSALAATGPALDRRGGGRAAGVTQQSRAVRACPATLHGPLLLVLRQMVTRDRPVHTAPV